MLNWLSLKEQDWNWNGLMPSHWNGSRDTWTSPSMSPWMGSLCSQTLLKA